MFIIEYVLLKHTLSILLPGIFHHNRFTHPYIDTSFRKKICSLVYFCNEIVQTGRRLTLLCSQAQPKIAPYFDLFKWRDLADSLENTLDIMRERTGFWFPVFDQLTVEPGP